MKKSRQTTIAIETSLRISISRTQVKVESAAPSGIARGPSTEADDSCAHAAAHGAAPTLVPYRWVATGWPSDDPTMIDLPPQPWREPGAAASDAAPGVCCASAQKSVRRQPAVWELSEEGFRRLLACLDADWERAGARYALLRQKLAKFFECRGCHTPDELADETINRVARRLAEGVELQAAEPLRYCYGVARNVLREYQQRRAKAGVPLDDLPPAQHPWYDPANALAQIEQRRTHEQQLASLQQCLAQLPPAQRQLLLAYYCDGARARHERRQELAAQLGITANALKIRLCRLRATLARQLNELCAARSELKPIRAPATNSRRPERHDP